MGGCLSSDENRLSKYYIDNTPKLAPREGQKVKIIGVYAGNLVTVAGVVGNCVYRFKVKLRGLLVPDVNSKDEDERRKANVVMDALSGYALNRIATISKIGSAKKMHAYEAYLFIDNQNLTNHLVNVSYARHK